MFVCEKGSLLLRALLAYLKKPEGLNDDVDVTLQQLSLNLQKITFFVEFTR